MAGALPNCLTREAAYWRESRRPLLGLAFTFPLLLIYEIGVLASSGAAARNGADLWLRESLGAVGLGGYFLLPVLTVFVLLAWHHTTGDRWSVSGSVLLGMLLESCVFGLILLLIVHLQGALLSVRIVGPRADMLPLASAADLSRVIGYLGAGIYEEVLFRLLLLPLLFAAIGLLGVPIAGRRIGAVLLASLIFSAAHYVGPYADLFSWFSFLFRFLAGGFFSVLFVVRGFGIAVGAHALYDIFVAML